MTSPAWSHEGDQVDAWYGNSVATAGDVNGDGFDDIVFIPFGGETNPNNEWRYHSSDEYNNGVYINKLKFYLKLYLYHFYLTLF